MGLGTWSGGGPPVGFSRLGTVLLGSSRQLYMTQTSKQVRKGRVLWCVLGLIGRGISLIDRQHAACSIALLDCYAAVCACTCTSGTVVESVRVPWSIDSENGQGKGIGLGESIAVKRQLISKTSWGQSSCTGHVTHQE